MSEKQNSTENYYEIIGVKKEASHDDIHRACNKLLLKYHPDRCKDANACDKTIEINAIKEVLLNEEKRKAYDITISLHDDEYEVREGIPRQPEYHDSWCCDSCGDSFGDPFACRECGGKFCSEHILCKDHNCIHKTVLNYCEKKIYRDVIEFEETLLDKIAKVFGL